MDLVQGALILEKIPNEEAENKVIQFLSQYTKTLSPDKLKLILKKAPVTLFKNISARNSRARRGAAPRVGRSPAGESQRNQPVRRRRSRRNR